jgi:hypothetical protein
MLNRETGLEVRRAGDGRLPERQSSRAAVGCSTQRPIGQEQVKKERVEILIASRGVNCSPIGDPCLLIGVRGSRASPLYRIINKRFGTVTCGAREQCTGSEVISSLELNTSKLYRKRSGSETAPDGGCALTRDTHTRTVFRRALQRVKMSYAP